jgi:electron transport complex protein RnfB
VNQNDVYEQLARKFGRPGSKDYMETLEAMMTPEEGRLILELPSMMNPEELSKKVNIDPQTLSARLDNMARRGLLYREKGMYVSWPDAHQLGVRVSHSADEYIPAKLIELNRRPSRRVDMGGETSQRLKRFDETGVPGIKIIPARLAILASPKIRPEDVLWHEDMAEIIRRNGGYGVVDCPCRRNRQNCDMPLWACVHTRPNIVEYEVGRGGRMKRLNVEEAIENNDMVERAGLVHETPYNAAMIPGVICNCCICCCGVLIGSMASGRPFAAMAPSRFRATVAQELCTGCQTCIERCPFDAIEMVKVAGSKKMKARVIAEKCFGCGVCVVGCKDKALTFELVRPPEHIPAALKGAVGSGAINRNRLA